MAKSEISKSDRMKVLVELIREGGYNSQEALAFGIKKKTGDKVTQATVSRDLKELKVEKNNEGNYVLGETYARQLREAEFADVFRKYAKDVKEDVQLVGVQVQSGFSRPLALEIEKMGWRGVIGTLCSEELLLIAIDRQSSETIGSGKENYEKSDAKIISEYLSNILNLK